MDDDEIIRALFAAAERTREPAYDEAAALARFEAWLQSVLDEG